MHRPPNTAQRQSGVTSAFRNGAIVALSEKSRQPSGELMNKAVIQATNARVLAHHVILGEGSVDRSGDLRRKGVEHRDVAAGLNREDEITGIKFKSVRAGNQFAIVPAEDVSVSWTR